MFHHVEQRGHVDCNHAFNNKRTKFSLAIKAVKYIEANIGIEDDSIKDAAGNVALLMQRQLALCIAWNATGEAEYSTAAYVAGLEEIGKWFIRLMEVLALMAAPAKATAPAKDGDAKPGDSAKPSADDAKDPKAKAAKLLKDLADILAKPIPSADKSDAKKKAKEALQPLAATGAVAGGDLAGDAAADENMDPAQLHDDLKRAIEEEPEDVYSYSD